MRRRASSCTTKCMPTWIATAWYERGFPCVVLVNTQVVTLALRTRGCHLPFHQRMPATAVENRVEFAREAESIALRASDAQLAYYFRGMGQALPVEVFPVFTPSELETLFTGSSHINLSVLKSATDYHNCSEADPHIQCVAPRAVRECFCVSVDVSAANGRYFWETMQGLSQDQLSQFVNFSYARSRLPPSADQFPHHFKLEGPTPAQEEEGDKALPHAATCFFKL